MTAFVETIYLRRFVAVLATVWVVSLAGCQRDDRPLSRFSCRCTFLTDTDDTSEQRVEVCATATKEACYEAEGCAQSAAPAPIQACQCEPLSGSEPCPAKTCKVSEYR